MKTALLIVALCFTHAALAQAYLCTNAAGNTIASVTLQHPQVTLVWGLGTSFEETFTGIYEENPAIPSSNGPVIAFELENNYGVHTRLPHLHSVIGHLVENESALAGDLVFTKDYFNLSPSVEKQSVICGPAPDGQKP